MSEIILHHYDLSPYSEKVRLMFGLKGLAWRSVQIPIVMPKPDYTELTGGYRRTPMMQIGADIYCDSKLCAQVLERLYPTPTLFPVDVAAIWGLSRWAETGFLMAVLIFFGIGGLFDEAFVADRKKMAPQLDLEQVKKIVPAKILQLAQILERLERQLSDGRAFLFGASASLVDLAAYHTTYFLNARPVTAALLEPHAHVRAWHARVAAIGHGERKELDAAEAIAIAHDATPVPFEGEPAPLPDGLAYGDRVIALPEEIGSGSIPGELAPSDLHEIAIRRTAPRAGELVVHFPREDYLVVRA
ncbi:MAG TPA: glutathione S-transferase family protein [Myxococcota bacterium]|nr:glutathione S-transferase family protein [Myxococcota bacterium]